MALALALSVTCALGLGVSVAGDDGLAVSLAWAADPFQGVSWALGVCGDGACC